MKPPGAYLKAAGIAVRPPGGWGRRAGKTGQRGDHRLWRGKTGHRGDSRPTPTATPTPTPKTFLRREKQKPTSKPANEVITDSEVITTEPSNQTKWLSAARSQRQCLRAVPGSHRAWGSAGAAMPWRSGRTWCPSTASPAATRACSASCASCVERKRPKPACVIVTAPGEEAQVDYGTGPMVRDPESGKYRRTRLFVMTLGYSRKSVRLLTFRSSSRIWAELHERAFRRLGGATRIVVLDNLREGVLVPDIYDPALNPLYRDVLAHYGAVAMPCRIQDPDRKGKVESGVGHAQKTPLKGLRFESLEEAQAYLDHWEQRWADTRIHGTTKRQVAAMFAEEKPTLLPLPVEPFRYYQYGERIVHLDGCVEVEAAYYGAPPGWIGRVRPSAVG